MVGALAHLLTGRFADFVDAIGDRGLELQPVAADAFVVAAEAIGAPARIRMAAGGANRLARDIKPRAGDMPGFDRGFDAPVGTAGVAHGSEAAVEHGAQSRRRA